MLYIVSQRDSFRIIFKLFWYSFKVLKFIIFFIRNALWRGGDPGFWEDSAKWEWTCILGGSPWLKFHRHTHRRTYTHIDLQLWHVSFVWRSFTTDITIRVVFSKSFWNKKTNIFGNNWIIKKIIIYITWVGSYLQKKLFYMIKALF